MTEYEEMTYEERAKDTFKSMRINPSHLQIKFLAASLQMEHELGDKACIQRHLKEHSNDD